MNEEQKNIETCLAEDILAEVANVPTDPQFRSLVEESFDPLQQQALQQTGYDGYEKVVMYHQPYTFTSAVAQMKSNLILLLRRLWRFPFGRGTIRSLADMWQHYITRLKGNPEYGIPSRLSSLTDFPSAPALLADRKISDLGDCPDGISLAQILGNSGVPITDILDDNYGWVMNKAISGFPNLENVVLNCKSIYTPINLFSGFANLKHAALPYLENLVCSQSLPYFFNNCPELETLDLRSFKTANFSWGRILSGLGKLKVLDLPEFTSNHGDNTNMISNCPMLEELYLPKSTYLGAINNESYGTLLYLPKLKKVVFGEWPNIVYRFGQGGSYSQIPVSYGIFQQSTNLIHLEIGSCSKNMYLTYWSPTNALDASRTDLIEEGSTAQNNLQQFLQNFRDYIAERLADNGTGLTLTLSQEVRNAIHAAEATYGIENIIITQKGWTISPAPN